MKPIHAAVTIAFVLSTARVGHADPPADGAAPPQVDATATAVRAALDEDRAARRDHEEAEERFKSEAITFGTVVVATHDRYGTSVHQGVLPYLGGRPLSNEDFYRAVDRPDLADRYTHRSHVATGAIVLGSATTLASLYFFAQSIHTSSTFCDPFASNYATCQANADAQQRAADADASRNRNIGFAVAGAGVAISIVGLYYLATRNPVSINEAYALADEHNARLRRKYMLSHDVKLAPYGDAGGGGMVVAGRF